MSNLPECFGKMWDVIQDCKNCGAEQDCLGSFALVALPECARAMKTKHPEMLAQVTGSSPEAIRLALEYAEKSGKPASGWSLDGKREPPPKKVAEVPEPEEVAEEVAPLAESFDEMLVAVNEAADLAEAPVIPDPEIESGPPMATASDHVGLSFGPAATGEFAEPSRVVQGPAKKRGRPRKVIQVDPEEGNREEVGRLEDPIPDPPKRGRGRPKKQVVEEVAQPKPKKAKGSPKNPRLTGSVKRASDPVPSARSSVELAPAQDGRFWGDWETRWRRERAKHPEIGGLVPGMILRRDTLEGEAQVKVLRMGYKWNLQEFPTLQAATEAIVGVRGKWSASRFWKSVLIR